MWLKAWQLSLGAWMKGVHLGILDVMMMQVRRLDTTLLTNQLIVAKQSGLAIEIGPLSAHMLAGGNIRRVIDAMISAKRFAIPLTLERACAVDLIGQDPLQLIADTVHEVGRIPAPVGDSGYGAHQKPPLNPASVLLQATPGTLGSIIESPRLTARVRFPQGELDVAIRASHVPSMYSTVRVLSVDGITIMVEPHSV
jgi:hypothetical protein